MLIHFVVVICLMCVQASQLLHLNKSRLCVVHMNHTECTVLCNISLTLQFDLNAHKTDSDRINIWSQVPQWARHQDVLTDHQ
jgi:hypothetical protein